MSTYILTERWTEYIEFDMVFCFVTCVLLSFEYVCIRDCIWNWWFWDGHLTFNGISVYRHVWSTAVHLLQMMAYEKPIDSNRLLYERNQHPQGKFCFVNPYAVCTLVEYWTLMIMCCLVCRIWRACQWQDPRRPWIADEKNRWGVFPFGICLFSVSLSPIVQHFTLLQHVSHNQQTIQASL